MANSRSTKKRTTAGTKPSVDAAAEASINKDASKDAAKAAKTETKKPAANRTAVKKADGKKVESKKADQKKVDKNRKPSIFKRFVQYCRDVKMELKRVTWPTKQEVWRSSLVVVGALVFFGLLIFAIDSAIVPLLQLYSGLAA